MTEKGNLKHVHLGNTPLLARVFYLPRYFQNFSAIILIPMDIHCINSSFCSTNPEISSDVQPYDVCCPPFCECIPRHLLRLYFISGKQNITLKISSFARTLIQFILQIFEMSIRITLRLIIASLASLLLTATVIAIKNFHLHLWKSPHLGDDSQSQIESGILTDSLQLPGVSIDQGDLRQGMLPTDNIPEAQVPALLSDNKDFIERRPL